MIENILMRGGVVDFRNKIIEPVIITKDLENSMDNYNEYYAPVYRIMLYNNESELVSYFSEEKFQRENMNISLFGESKYVNNLKNSIILNDRVVSEIDNGYCEFGGYGEDASLISYKGIEISKPILINREIENIYFNAVINSLKPDERKIDIVISREFEKIVKLLFKDNLKFAFTFKSTIDQRHNDVYDKNFMICMNVEDTKARIEFKKWYFNMLYKYGKVPNCYNPGIIVTEKELEKILLINEQLEINLNNDEKIYKSILLAQVMSEKKDNILGDNKEIEKYEQKFNKYVYIWCKKVFDFLVKNNLIEEEREYTKCLFALDGNLVYLSEKLKYNFEINKEIDEIVSELDDGFLRIVLKKQYKS